MEKEEQSHKQIIFKQQNVFEETSHKYRLLKVTKMITCKCQCGNDAYHICIQKKCKESALICNQSSGQCSKNFHQSCYVIQIDRFVSKIQNKILDINDYVIKHNTMVNEFIDKIIDEASKMKDLYKEYAQRHYKFSLLTQVQKKVWLMLNDNNMKQMKGLQFSALFTQMFQNPQKSDILCIQDEQQMILKIWKQLQSDTLKSLKQIQSQLLSNNTISINLKQKQILFQKSNIIKSPEETQIMFNLLNRKVKTVEMLYKSTQNQFKLDNFYNKCTNIPNTLILVHTQYGKKVGGFTPLCWKKEQQNYQCLVDKSNSSFIFSLSNNEKLIQKNLDKSGIRNSLNNGPIFDNSGSGDIYICNQANKNTTTIRFNHGYSNETYKQISKQTLQRFNGSPNNSQSIKLLQWQVWKVVFQ